MVDAKSKVDVSAAGQRQGLYSDDQASLAEFALNIEQDIIFVRCARLITAGRNYCINEGLGGYEWMLCRVLVAISRVFVVRLGFGCLFRRLLRLRLRKHAQESPCAGIRVRV